MEAIPAIDNFFNLEEALKNYGFKIDEKDDGVCIAYDYWYGDYGEVWIEFNQAFINNYQTDMRVSRHFTEKYIPQQETVFLGVAPTNQHDFDMLMQLLFPSDAFKDRLETNILNL
ncbi:MAG: hypothetical protein IKM85_06755 [Bacteroidales bacterium]|nr:hypothetical protein [Bacteroidales bacterium]